MSKTLRLEVLQRFLSQDQINELMYQYSSNKKATGKNINRFDAAAEPLTDLEIAMARFWINEKGRSIRRFEIDNNLPENSARSILQKSLVKIIYQTNSLEGLLASLSKR